MDLDRVWGMLGVWFLSVVIGVAFLLIVTYFLPRTTLEAIVNIPYILGLLWVLTFTISFPSALFPFRKNTNNKKALARNFAVLYFVFYGLFGLLDYQGLTTIFVATAFPLLAFLFTNWLAVESRTS